MSNYEDLRGAAANEEIILDDQGIPSVMVKVPLVYLDELGIGSAHTPHPAFIINDKVVPYIYVSKYINVIKNNRAYSIPNQDPANCITFDRAVEVCYNKGAGWHLMTAAEWGVLHNLITAQGLEPRGNTNNGRHHVKTWERGSNENQNKLVRRHIPKGVNFDDKTQGDIDNIAEWINNYPRRLFEYQSAEKLYNDELKKIAA